MGDLSKYHPSVAAVLKWFEGDHLPEHLAEVSAKFRTLAFELADAHGPSPELTVGLRRLLEAKDCMVRAAKETHDAIPQATPGDSAPTQADVTGGNVALSHEVLPTTVGSNATVTMTGNSITEGRV